MLKKTSIVLAILLTLSLFTMSIAGAAPSQSTTSQNFIVLYRQAAVPSDAAGAIANAGGSLVYSYDKIGVAIASSDSEAFSSNLLADKRVEGVSATSGFGIRLEDSVEEVEVLLDSPIDDEPLGFRQWDMRQIFVPEAHAITTGSPDVVVGDLDTGLDYTHPDLAANVDFSRSVSCEGGVPNQDPAAWMDHNGHGTHTAGTIAAADNGIGIIGVAPNVKIAGIKTSNDDGYFFPEAVVCAFMWVAEHDIDVTNNSYFADPWRFNCRNDPEQRAIWKAEQRAIRYAMSKGVTVVSSAGNENEDMAHVTTDTQSPDYPPGSEVDREVTNACVKIPVEIPGVIGVSANGFLGQKSYYSSYGVGVVQVVAPGGDSRYQIPPAPIANGRVLSTFPGNRYALAQGTSMASPHVAGVAALVVSAFGEMAPGRLQAIITGTADPVPCPPNPFDPSGTGATLAYCQGGDGYNSFYGHGQVNAYNAVTHTP